MIKTEKRQKKPPGGNHGNKTNDVLKTVEKNQKKGEIMSDLTVVLDRKKMTVSLESEAIRIDRPDFNRPKRIPLNMVERVVVIGNPMVSCAVWRALAKRSIPAVMIPSRGWDAVAYPGPGLSANITRRLDQYRAFLNPYVSLSISRWIVEEKLKAQKKTVQTLFDIETDHIDRFREFIRAAGKSESVESLLGNEGAAAVLYFSVFSQKLDEKWSFAGRNRRPPRDPVNALLSLSYVMAALEVQKAILKKSLDPTLGFVHSPKNGRDSFVLDILEPIRPFVDRFVIRLLDNPLQLSDFTYHPGGGCLLNKNGRGKYYSAWADLTNPELVEEDIGKMADHYLFGVLSFCGIDENEEAEENA
jgi:CRISPR-associated protein Cas1